MTDFTMEKDADGVAIITWDTVGKSMNVMNQAGFEELDALIDQVLADDAIKGAILTSGKDGSFAGGMDLNIIAEAFVVVVIGGMGSVAGAFVAAILISVLNAFAVLFFPQISLILPFVVMAIVLIVRPYGLFGAASGAHGAPPQIGRASGRERV